MSSLMDDDIQSKDMLTNSQGFTQIHFSSKYNVVVPQVGDETPMEEKVMLPV